MYLICPCAVHFIYWKHTLIPSFTHFLFIFAFQSNFATLDENTGVVTSRRADRHFEEEGPILCAALDGMKLPSYPGYEVRVK